MRSSGILMPISSLASKYGIGTLGAEAYKFADFLEEAGQHYWQVLPIGPTSYGDSPYQSFSTFAGNPYFIDLDLLCEEGLLEKAEVETVFWGDDPTKINYGILYENRYPVLRKAYERFIQQEQTAFEQFKKEAGWVYDYALFMSLKEANGNVSWQEWPQELKVREEAVLNAKKEELKDDIGFYIFLQFKFYQQWFALKKYANEKGIQIIGDIPIYVALDSADVWMNPGEYDLDEKLVPNKVAGCPPDAFAVTGQLWGNPLYRWDVMKANGYRWWLSRIAHALKTCDVVRIDHFRGFDSYYAIPGTDKTAENGEWLKGPGMDLFSEVKKQFGDVHIIAEDLGFMTDSVKELLKNSGYPGMKILQFGFNPEFEDSVDQPHNYVRNCVAYTGTHDNSTIMGWLHSADKNTVKHCMEYLDIKGEDGFYLSAIKRLMTSVADTVIIPLQDYLGLDDTARINIPSTTDRNWQWRAQDTMLTQELAVTIRQITKYSQRLKK